MPLELLSALCLVAVLEGLFLFAAPGLWRRTMEVLMMQSPDSLRWLGGLLVVAGLLTLWISRVG